MANDATDEVLASKEIDLIFNNNDPNEYFINRVYRAWNEGVLQAPTPLVCMLNSDMFVSDHWLDELMQVRKRNPRTVPTSLLVESGKLPSAMPEYVRNFGMNPSEFDADEFRVHAETIRKRDALDAGRLYMPILVNRQEFIDIGMYPEGNPPGTTGDKDLLRRYDDFGYKHVTALGSVVYHVQTGESSYP